jgi:hypothetical protein
MVKFHCAGTQPTTNRQSAHAFGQSMDNVVNLPTTPRERYYSRHLRKVAVALANQGIPAEGRRVIVDDLVRRLDSVAFKFQCDDNIPHELASAAFHEAVGVVTAVIVQLEIELWYSKQNAK